MFERKLYRSDMIRCALCQDAPCTKACGRLDPARLLRMIWFDNEKTAACALPGELPCSQCSAPCEQACVRPGQISIRDMMLKLKNEVKPSLEIEATCGEDRLQTDFCGIPLENPFLLSSSVVASTYDMCARAFEAGWAGAAFKTICSFDIHEASPRYFSISGDNGDIIGFKNIEQLSGHTVQEDMEILKNLKKNYPSKFILASIMGKDEADWQEVAKACEESGADALELNFSCPNMMDTDLGSAIGQVPELVERFTALVRQSVRIPVIAKLTPNVESMKPAAMAAKRGGADGLAAINTIKSIMGINPHTYVSAPAVHGMSAVGGYSGNAVRPIALRFIMELTQDPELKDMYISGMGGIETWMDALEFLLLGSGSVQVTTAVMQYGYRIIEDLKAGLNYYLTEKGFDNVRALKGLSLDFVSDTTDVIERGSVLLPRFQREKCIGCGRCVISCMDGGHQALRMSADRKPILDGKRCVGCHLCRLVCPEKAISTARKRIYRG